MGINRRTFIQGAAIIAVAPIVANVMSLATPAQPNPAPITLRTPEGPVVSPIEMRVCGWHESGHAAFDRKAPANAERTNDSSESEPVLISVNQAWRTAWR
jgi:hypothetical protein